MSAYVSNPETFGLLAAYATLNKCGIYEWTQDSGTSIETTQRIAKGLARENIRSVAHRYPDDASGSRPGPSLLDEEIEEAAAIYAAHFLTNAHYVRNLKPIQIIVLAQGVDYQSCETDDWRDTLAWKQLHWIKSEAIRQLPGYSSADWSYSRQVPEIEALYEGSAA
jgi:hypothetical protein